MKFYTSIPISLKIFFNIELEKYKNEFSRGNFQNAWHYLERAHIIGQRYPYEHSLVHWKMLLFGIKLKNRKEIFGQIPRLLVGGVKSFVGQVPVGNPGGADVPPLKPFPIEKDILDMFQKAKVNIQ